MKEEVTETQCDTKTYESERENVEIVMVHFSKGYTDEVGLGVLHMCTSPSLMRGVVIRLGRSGCRTSFRRVD